MAYNNRHDRMRHEAMQLRQQVHLKAATTQSNKPFFSEPVKIQRQGVDPTALRIQNILGDYDDLQPFVAHQSKALLGISSGAPHTPRLDKLNHKTGPKFPTTSSSTNAKSVVPGNQKNGRLKHHTKTANSASETDSNLQVDNSLSVKTERGTDRDAIHNTESAVVRQINPVNEGTGVVKPKEVSTTPIGGFSTNYSTKAYSDNTYSPSCPVLTKEDTLEFNISTTVPPKLERLDDISPKKNPTLPKIVLPPTDTRENTTDDVQDIIKEMTAVRTPLTGIFTPQKDSKIFPYPQNVESDDVSIKEDVAIDPSHTKESLSPKTTNTPKVTPVPTTISSDLQLGIEDLKKADKQEEAKNAIKTHPSQQSTKKTGCDVGGMTVSETSCSESDSLSETESGSSDDDGPKSRRNRTKNNAIIRKAPSTAKPDPQSHKETSWSLKNFLPDKPDIPKPAANDSTESRNSQKSSQLFSDSNNEESGSEAEVTSAASDGSDSENEGSDNSLNKTIYLGVHNRIARKSPNNYISQVQASQANSHSFTKYANPSHFSVRSSPINDHVSPSITVSLPKHSLSNLIQEHKKNEEVPAKIMTPDFVPAEPVKSSKETSSKKRVTPQSRRPSISSKRKSKHLKLSESSEESDMDTTDHPIRSSDTVSQVHYHRMQFGEEPPNSPDNFSDTLHRTDMKNSQHSPHITPSFQHSTHTKPRERTNVKHKSMKKNIPVVHEEPSIKTIMQSVKTETVLSPLRDDNLGSIGTVHYDSDGKATIIVKLNLSLLDHISLKESNNVNMNLISPDSGISEISNAHDHYENDRESNSEFKGTNYKKHSYKNDDSYRDKERGNENFKLKYRDKQTLTPNETTSKSGSINQSNHSDESNSHKYFSHQRSLSKDSSRSSKSRSMDSSSTRSESRSSKHKRRHHESSSVKESKRSKPSKSPQYGTERGFGSTNNWTESKESGNGRGALSPDKLRSDSRTCPSSGDKNEFGGSSSTTIASDAQSMFQGTDYKTLLASGSPASNHPANQIASTDATDLSDNWNLDRRRPVSNERLLSADEYLADAKRLKHQADGLSDKLVKSLQYTEAVLCFMLCGYAMERDNITETHRIFGMYKDTLRLVASINNRFKSNATDPEASGKDKKLTVLSFRIQALLSLKLYKLKTNNALKLKRIIDDHNKMCGSNSQRSVTAPSPAQPCWTARSTGTPSPMSPTPSPAGSICSVGSQGSMAEYSGKVNSTSHIMMPGSASNSVITSPGYVTIPQRIQSVTHQYLTITHYLVQANELWVQADMLAKDCKDFLDASDVPQLMFHSDIWDLVQYVRYGLAKLKAS